MMMMIDDVVDCCLAVDFLCLPTTTQQITSCERWPWKVGRRTSVTTKSRSVVDQSDLQHGSACIRHGAIVGLTVSRVVL